MSPDLKAELSALISQAIAKAGERGAAGQTRIRVLASAVAASERTVYRWSTWAVGGAGIAPSAGKARALARYAGWAAGAIQGLTERMLDGEEA